MSSYFFDICSNVLHDASLYMTADQLSHMVAAAKLLVILSSLLMRAPKKAPCQASTFSHTVHKQ